VQHVNRVILKLQANNFKAAYLSILRVLMSLFLLKEILFKSLGWSLLYSNNSVLHFKTHSAFLVSGINVFWLKEHYLFVLSFYILMLLFFLFGIGKNIVACLCFLLLFLLQKINNVEVNGGDVLARFSMLCLCFCNSFQYLCYKPNTSSTPFKNVVSNLAVLSIMIQLCVAYLLAFYHKINNSYWQNGTAMYYIFNTEAYMSFRFNKTLANQNWIVYISTYFTLVLEFLFPIFIWIKRFRKPLIIGGLLLHLGIYIFMMLYNLQFVFISIYGLFLSNNWWIAVIDKVELKLKKLQKKY
jgi:hypothetical protein